MFDILPGETTEDKLLETIMSEWSIERDELSVGCLLLNGFDFSIYRYDLRDWDPFRVSL